MRPAPSHVEPDRDVPVLDGVLCRHGIVGVCLRRAFTVERHLDEENGGGRLAVFDDEGRGIYAFGVNEHTEVPPLLKNGFPTPTMPTPVTNAQYHNPSPLFL